MERLAIDPTLPNSIVTLKELTVSDSITYYSHLDHQQDRWVIKKVFNGKRNGYFVEAGAGGQSNTYALETQFGWTGLGVEPHPRRYLDIKDKRSCVLENVCLTDVESEVEFLINHAAPGTSGIQGVIGDGIRNLAYHDNGATETVRLKGYPLVDLLRKHGAPKQIDYLSLDVEGAEWLILKNFPFDEYSFRCMTIERGSNDYLRLRAKLLGQGYRLVKVGCTDDYWLHPSVPYRVPVPDMLNSWARRLVQPIKARLKGVR